MDASSHHPARTPASPGAVTALLHAAAGGEPRAADELLPLIYAQLRALAQGFMGGERSDHTLQATALVHEAYVRLVQGEHVDWKGRAHFYVAAAEAMRRVLIDHARRRGAVKRGGKAGEVTLNLADLVAGRGLDDLLAVDEALDALHGADPRAADVVRLRFFAGLGVNEIARVLDLAPRTVDREWEFARAWLRRHLGGGAPPGDVGGEPAHE